MIKKKHCTVKQEITTKDFLDLCSDNFLKEAGTKQIKEDGWKLWLKQETSLSKTNQVLARNSNLPFPISLQPDGGHLWYFKLRSFGLTELSFWNS